MLPLKDLHSLMVQHICVKSKRFYKLPIGIVIPNIYII